MENTPGPLVPASATNAKTKRKKMTKTDKDVEKTLHCVICQERIEPGEKRKPSEAGTAHETCLECQICGATPDSLVAATLVHESVFSGFEKAEECVVLCREHYWISEDTTLPELRKSTLGKGDLFETREIHV